MRDDVVMKLLREVKAGKVSVEDARDALSEVELSEDAYQKAVDHGVFNDPEPGTIIRASISPSSDSWLVIIFAMCCLVSELHSLPGIRHPCMVAATINSCVTTTT